ncbi:hypothetical protein D3C73_1467680 [compost metagenome]
MHIDKIDDYNSPHITQTQLTRNFFCCFHIDQQCIVFLILLISRTVTTVDINDMQGFGMLYNEVRTARQCYSFAKSCLDLLFNSEMIKNWLFMFIKFDNFL